MKNFFSCLIVMLSALVTYADGVTFVGKSPSVVGVGQRISVSYELNQKPSSIQIGKMSGFKLVGGPSQSSSTSVNIVNGSMTKTSTYSYTYILEAVSEGSQKIEEAVAIVDGKKYTSNQITVKVQKDPVQTQRSSNSFYDPFEEFFGGGNSQQQQQQVQTVSKPTKDDLFIRVNLSKNKLTKGEGVLATIKLYSRADVVAIEDYKLPSFNDFYSEEIDVSKNIAWTVETINGKQYRVGLLNKFLLYPRVSGSVEIEPAEISCVIRVKTGARNFWGAVYDNMTMKVSSPKQKLNVANLPNAPADFMGAVGNFKIDIKKGADTVSVNEAVTYKVTITGSGNFNTIETPKLNCPKEFEMYDPVATQKTNTTDVGVSGSKTWEYTIIPRYEGLYNLGTISLVYYDITSKQYKTLSTGEIVLNVKKGDGTTTASEQKFNSQSEIEMIGSGDIRYIKTGNMHLSASYVPMMLSGSYLFAILILLAIFVAFVIILHNKIRKGKDVELMKKKRASNICRKHLKNARKYMQANDNVAFYKEIITTLWGYAGDKLAIPTAQLTKDKVMETFNLYNVDEELGTQFINLIDTCEFAHFVSGSNENELQNIYNETVKIIEQLEEKIK